MLGYVRSHVEVLSTRSVRPDEEGAATDTHVTVTLCGPAQWRRASLSPEPVLGCRPFGTTPRVAKD